MMRHKFLVFSLTIFLTSCCTHTKSHFVEHLSYKAIKQCEKEVEIQTGHKLSTEINNAYVESFDTGIVVAFTKGSVGSFGKRSDNYQQYWACGIFNKKVVYLGSSLKVPIIDIPNKTKFIDYRKDVKEFLFRRVNGDFEFCCKQKLDEKNMERNNPNFPWNDNAVG